MSETGGNGNGWQLGRLIGRDLLVGIAVQYDRVVRKGRSARSSDDGPVAKIGADGWMAGPLLETMLPGYLAVDVMLERSWET